MKNTTIVTGLWDLGRGNLEGWAKRNFDDYKIKFFQLLETDIPMCIWVSKDLKEEVLNIRKNKPTHIFIKELEDFKTWNPFFSQIQKIRTNPEWYNSAGWLSESPQASLEYYNAMMMCKMFMLHDSSIINPFNSDYIFWIDGGITNTVSKEYFLDDNVFNKLKLYINNINKFTFIHYPYTSNNEIHGFERGKLAEYCNVEFVDKVCRGGFFGGKIKDISKINELYYYYLDKTLNENLMGADECLFTILYYNHKDLIDSFEIEGNGLIWPFFEYLKNLTPNQALYVLSYNSPEQFKTLIRSFQEYDINFLNKPKKYLINNSTNKEKFSEYDDICKEYDFEEIHFDNIGICGGRQFIAEHAHNNKFDYYTFFEDDMFFYNGDNISCRNGFIRKINNLYNDVISILDKENLDFLKFNFTEFYGDNSQQWAWHNVPQNIREKLFPEKPIKNNNNYNETPLLKYNYIKSYNNIPYAVGEVFYCNWPQIVSYKGNQKLFLDTKWEYPMEQTWMSHIYQETVNGNIKSGVLLATPTEHNRFEFYPGEERREN